MRIYQVGGVVRDKLLQRHCHDKDYVVVGSTEEEMIKDGFKKVGKSFPVFLHPETGEEYALARKEIKTGNRHCDFTFIFTPDISLEEDYRRRDFTCNALYICPETEEIIDYCQGQKDISNRVLRHVSEHFAEDPLRVLRMCRFAAQLDFSVAPETMDLCRQMVKDGALQHLKPERVWSELEKALRCKTFYRFVETARECGALEVLLPEVEKLWQIPERTDYHPEGNSGAHTFLAVKAAQSNDPMVNFAVLLHDVGKARTNPDLWPSHRGHDKLGEPIVKEIGRRLKAPEAYTSFASFTTANHMLYHRCLKEVAPEIAGVSVVLSHHQAEEYFRRYTAVLKSDMLGRALPDFTCELECFKKFEDYLHRLTQAATETKMSEVPDFELMLEQMKNNEIPNTALKEAHITLLLQKTPL